jgi:hypothetical protein
LIVQNAKAAGRAVVAANADGLARGETFENGKLQQQFVIRFAVFCINCAPEYFLHIAGGGGRAVGKAVLQGEPESRGPAFLVAPRFFGGLFVREPLSAKYATASSSENVTSSCPKCTARLLPRSSSRGMRGRERERRSTLNPGMFSRATDSMNVSSSGIST